MTRCVVGTQVDALVSALEEQGVDTDQLLEKVRLNCPRCSAPPNFPVAHLHSTLTVAVVVIVIIDNQKYQGVGFRVEVRDSTMKVPIIITAITKAVLQNIIYKLIITIITVIIIT